MKKWLTSLPAKIVESVLGALVFAWLAQGGVFGEDIELWIALVAILAFAALAFAIGRRGAAQTNLYPYYAEHVREALNTLQKVVAGAIVGVTTDEFVERGILAPACYWLTPSGDEQVRMTVIRPKEPDGTDFELIWEFGHSVEARAAFSLKVVGSFAGVAYSRGETQWSNDVEKDARWARHPKARRGRAYGSLASVPISVGDEVVAVLNVISKYKKAFSPADLNYIELLGALINVIYSAEEAAAGGHNGAD